MTAPAAFRADDALQATVLAVLGQHVGESNAIRRVALVLAVARQTLRPGRVVTRATLDRKVRDAIAALRSVRGAGALICSKQDGSGYWIAANVDEMERHLAKEKSRLASLAESIRSQEQNARAAFAEFERRRVEQMEMFR